MKNIVLFLLLFVFHHNFCSAQDVCTALEMAVKQESAKDFDSIWKNYCNQYSPIDISSVKDNDTLFNLYQIYMDNFPQLLTDTLSFCDHYDYFLISQNVRMGFVEKIDKKNSPPELGGDYVATADWFFQIFSDITPKIDCDYHNIQNFRPQLSLNKPIFYLDYVLDTCIHGLWLAQNRDTTLKNDKYGCFKTMPQVWYWTGTFDIGSAPHLDVVLFDRKMRKAIFYYKFVGTQYAMILKKKKSGWIKEWQGSFLVY